MKTIQVYDPPLCCSTGVCGPEVDTELVAIAGWLNQLTQRGIQVERYNLAQQPLAFAQNPRVRAQLEKDSTNTLPLIFIDGELRFQGYYPTDEERKTLIESIHTSDT